ncbi:phosphopantothenoylcysteine decarboxylase/phosphopantothenate--cysteine ligase [Methanofollis sp. W23]|uniref:bifunctional phosphopantothenoylcysteine decarboxylase/phosphopantothenate--cysteine ligase CoaBC n=1 Tax=Methanofollis sp. W23 TaxID=2817849 RepID=UPI001AE1B92C|nr:bifunctional phosphopantothenoylcysteine decarboxylase/phosphopantothenate--cysteine ligase CoaBC [Methanofollis sp. W23]MBP2145912.1 phosphopantothenoylcysteine decarboxylase/phosphopantothenate--cysteine ligase [Methanofollis sp. W23]
MSDDRRLSGKTVVLAVTGSIAAVETVKLAHELRRRGAEVQAVMSGAACGIVHPDALTYATGRETITRCTGMVEHVVYCGEGGCADLLLVAPCTANTIGKIAVGVDDTPVTTFATTALGRGMPVVVVPAMHESMYRHPGVVENLEKLRTWGIDVVPPRIEEEKAKIAGIEEIVLHVERALSGRPLAGKRVVVTSGACAEPVDDVRVLTTRSTGRMGRALALEAFRLGAGVTVVHAGPAVPCVENVHVETAAEMMEAALSAVREGADYYLSAAAISDFAPVRSVGKIPSGAPVPLTLRPLPKVLDAVLRDFKGTAVAFKLGWAEEARAEEMIRMMGVRMVVMNTPPAMGATGGEFEILTAEGKMQVSGTKEEVAEAIWSALR